MKDTKNTKWKKNLIEKREVEISKVKKAFGFKKIEILDFPAANLDTIPNIELVSSISKFIKLVKPEIIYFNHFNDAHSDHRIIFNAVLSATKNFRSPFIKSLRMYEVLSETNVRKHDSKSIFHPNLFIDITKFIKKKNYILKIYKSEIKKFPFPRSIESINSLAKLRGTEVNYKFAEAFMILYEKK